MYISVMFYFLPDVCRVIELLDRLQRSGELPPPKLQAYREFYRASSVLPSER